MTRVLFTNIQRRSIHGSLIGLSPDVALDVEDMDNVEDAIQTYLGDEGSPSYSWKEIEE